MRKILRWGGISVGVALLLGAVVLALTGSVVFGAVATGVVVLVAVNVAAFTDADRQIAARGGIPFDRPRGKANGVAPVSGANDAGAGDGGGFDGGGGGGDGGGG